MNWNEIIKFEIKDWSFVLTIGPWLLLILVLGVIIYVIFFIKKYGLKFWERWDAVSAEISIGNIGTVTIQPNHDTINIAYKAWVELATRKAAIPFDEEHDVINEVYNSWYQLFERLRDLAKSIPAQQLRRNKDTKILVHIMVIVLNKGLRPHLTQWQAKYRRWYDSEISKGDNLMKTPQEIQKSYPLYNELISDLKRVNFALVKYANLLRKVAEGENELIGNSNE